MLCLDWEFLKIFKMGNNFFRFKQFTINQDKSAMKVGTDGVLIGAWAICDQAKNVLDIGAGTGLISIMIAQRCNAIIDAVEIDSDSFLQAQENVNSCPWKERIFLYHESIQEYAENITIKYDLIVSNPPFFNNSLKSENERKSNSKHTDLLSYSDLVFAVNKLIADNGVFSVILPFNEGLRFIEQCRIAALFCVRKTIIFPCPWKKASRVLLEFKKQETPIIENSLTVELSERHEYSAEYIDITKDFYL